MKKKTSRIPGFYKMSIPERTELVRDFADLTPEQASALLSPATLGLSRADNMIENVGGMFSLPVGFAPNFRIDGRDFILPMVIEEPSVVAAASNAAKLLRGDADEPGIVTSATSPIMIGQIQLLDVPNLAEAKAAIEAAAPDLVALASSCQPRLVERGGGARSLEVRVFPSTAVGPMLVVHLYVDVCDAMGANMINTMVELLAPGCEELSRGRACLKILSNLADQRLVSARGRIHVDKLARPDLGMDGHSVATRITEASVFAEVDPYRAATHNKGFMNGLDAFLIATGQDWRAVEAGAHAYAARSGTYTALATWRVDGDYLIGETTLPMQVGTVGGVIRVHPIVDILLQVVNVDGATQLGKLGASVGLAQNLAAIMALATEGIQRGHMSLHARNIAAAVGAADHEVDAIASEMVRTKRISRDAAAALVRQRNAAEAVV